MLNQLFIVNDVIGFALLIGLSLLLTILTKVSLFKGIVCFALVVSPFLYKAGFIDLWVIALLIILNVFIVIIIKKEKGA
jgi:hypothetical protein